DGDPNATLPPTVSTYKPRTPEIPPPPDPETLKEDLREALDDCRRNWLEASSMDFGAAPASKSSKATNSDPLPSQITEEDEEGRADKQNDDDAISTDEMPGPVPGLKEILLHTILRSTTLT